MATKLEVERLISPQYMAGCIDADGCISIVRMKQTGRGTSERHELRLQVTNTNLEFLEKLKESYGGYVQIRQRVIPRHKPVGNWKTQGALAETIIKEILPYLIIKADRAEIALKFRQTFGDNRKGQGSFLPSNIFEERQKAYLTMQLLNKRGTA